MPSRMIEFSAAAERALRRANELAAECGSPHVQSVHLLHALFLDESRAAEVLISAGLSYDILLQDYALQKTGQPLDENEPRQSGAIAAAVRQARRWLRETPGESEIRTEHLLAALATADAEVGGLLERLGLSPDAIRGAASGLHAQPLETAVRLRDPDPLENDGIAQTGHESLPHRQSPGDESHETTVGVSDPLVVRVLDAASNRCREGLRVVEDAARFVLDDAHLCARLKTLRHELVELLGRIGSERFHTLRDTAHDVGTQIGTPGGAHRGTIAHVLRANCKRVEEALRTLEEFGKLIDPHAAGELERLRYRFYTLEKALLTVFSSRERLADCRLYLLVTESSCRCGLEAVVKGALEGGVDAVQLREKGRDDRDLCETAARVRQWTAEAGALFIMNDRSDVAMLVGADGVHVGQDDLSAAAARRIVGPERLVGVSTHSVEQARQAVLDGADYIGVGPVFPSQTKSFDSLAGLDYVRMVAGDISLPWFAIGGITAENLPQVIDAGASRIAVSGAVCGAEDPRAAARSLRARLDA